MLLKDKNAVIYGAGGAVGSTVARAFAREGARVFLAGRTMAKLEVIAHEIVSKGGLAEVAMMDALDKTSVDNHLNDIVKRAGHIDISFNAIALGDEQGTLLVDMTQEHFALPIVTAMQTHFFTGTAAVRHMTKQKSGVILGLTANVAAKPSPVSGGFGVACAAIEGLFRQLACEAGPHNIRVVCMRSAGSPDTPGVLEAMALHAAKAGVTLEEFVSSGAQGTLLKRLPLLAEVANVAVIMSSDYASPVTGAVINVTCGELVD